jgi:hypothetical protein
MALWDTGMPFTLCRALYTAWKDDMQSAAAAARWLVAVQSADLYLLMQRVTDKGRLDVAVALLAGSSWDEARCSQQLVAWANGGRANLCHLLLTR